MCGLYICLCMLCFYLCVMCFFVCGVFIGICVVYAFICVNTQVGVWTVCGIGVLVYDWSFLARFSSLCFGGVFSTEPSWLVSM